MAIQDAILLESPTLFWKEQTIADMEYISKSHDLYVALHLSRASIINPGTT
jgi:hypothetical protein